MRFVHDTMPQRVRFATGEAAGHLAQEVQDLGATRLMVIASRPHRVVAERLVTDLPVAVWHHEITMHVPRTVAERACRIASRHAVDCLVSVGGGSTTGLAKVVALKTALPVIAVPTTYAGSEATPVWGMTEDGHKQTGADPRALPRAVIYDASLSRSLPVDISVASGLNALAHSIDSLWGPRADPINATLAAEGIRALAVGLPSVKAEPDDLAGREQTLYGAYLAATAFASAGAGQPEYVLTEKGHDLAAVIIALAAWGDEWAAPGGPPVIFEHQSSGGQVTQQLYCPGCGDQVYPGHGRGPARTRFPRRITDCPAAVSRAQTRLIRARPPTRPATILPSRVGSIPVSRKSSLSVTHPGCGRRARSRLMVGWMAAASAARSDT
jgi:maleylacetate reductase